MVPYDTFAAKYPNSNFDTDQLEMGIPSQLLVDATKDATAAAKILAEEDDNGPLFNFYYENDTNGDLVNPSANANSQRELNEMMHWSVVAARRAWWANDLPAAQTLYNKLSTSDEVAFGNCAENTDTTDSVSYASCDPIDYTRLNTF